MKKSKHYCKLIIYMIIIFCPCENIYLQQPLGWVDISLVDTVGYAEFEVNHIADYRYPPSHLFDAAFNTCWVSKLEKGKENPAVLFRLPGMNKIIVNIFSGYGKSKELYDKNSRPKKVQFSVFAAVNPQGYVSERGALYKAVEFPRKKVISLADSFGVQSVTLDFSRQELTDFRKKVVQDYDSAFEMAKAGTCLVLKMEILEAWQGTQYDDICISEIFFNDRFVSARASAVSHIENVYLDTDENTLLVDDKNHHGIIVYHDSSSVLQLIEVTENKKWAILISMPAEIEGRVETFYLLADLVNREVVNSQLEKTAGNYISGTMILFETGENGEQYLIYNSTDNEECRLELR